MMKINNSEVELANKLFQILNCNNTSSVKWKKNKKFKMINNKMLKKSLMIIRKKDKIFYKK